jgi:hypothetical protein
MRFRLTRKQEHFLFSVPSVPPVQRHLTRMALRWREQERNQVRHLFDRDCGFQTFRHQRKAGAGKLCYVATQDRISQAVGAFERQARRAFFSDDAVDRAAIFVSTV